MFPSRVLVMTGWHNDWLYSLMMPVLRERYGTTFYVVAAEDRIAEFKAKAGEGDVVVSVRFPGLEWRDGPADEEAVFAQARAYEQKYGLRYLRDIIQQDHSVAAYFLGYAPNSSFRRQPPSFAAVCDRINRCFAYFEQLLCDEKIDAIVNRPNGLENTAMTAVADSLGIPTTFFHGSYFQGDAVWASGPYMGPEFYRDVYDRTEEADPIPLEELAPSATWTRPPAPQLKTLLRGLAFTVLDYAIFAYRDLRAGKKSNRVPMRDNLISAIRQFQVQSYVDRTGVDDLDTLSATPFVYVAMPYEPEFTVQSLCKEFADTSAVIRQLALSLPAGYKLVLKEHQRIGNRTKEYYEGWLKYPNVVLAHPGLRGVDLIRRCAATATMGGSTPFEAAMHGKPSIVFGTQNPYSFLPSVQVVTNLRELPAVLDTALRPHSADEIMLYRRAAARFRKAYASVGFDASGTILFRSGKKREIEAEQISHAVDSFVSVIEAQRHRLTGG